jgi:hypothetical protein
MIEWFALAALTGTAAVCGSPSPGPAEPLARSVVFDNSENPASATTAATLRELWEGGVAWDAFLDATSARRALWMSNADVAAVPSDLLERAMAVPGMWRILVVAIDACSDSANSLPWVAKLAELVPSLDVRIIDSTVGREIMESHRTPDDRAATPTVLLLDANWNEAGCFIERPVALQQWYSERQGTMPVRELTERKIEWYAHDAGRATLDEMVAMLEGAAAGSPVCAASPAGG